MAETPMTPDVTQDDKLWAALSFAPVIGFWVALIAILMEDKKNRPFIKYHAVLALAFWVVVAIVGTITVGCIALAGTIYGIVLAFQIYQGQTANIPWLSDFVKKQGWA